MLGKKPATYFCKFLKFSYDAHMACGYKVYHRVEPLCPDLDIMAMGLYQSFTGPARERRLERRKKAEDNPDLPDDCANTSRAAGFGRCIRAVGHYKPKPDPDFEDPVWRIASSPTGFILTPLIIPHTMARWDTSGDEWRNTAWNGTQFSREYITQKEMFPLKEIKIYDDLTTKYMNDPMGFITRTYGRALRYAEGRREGVGNYDVTLPQNA